jgi:hypothetical protein
MMMFLLSPPIEAVSKCREVIPTIWQWHPPVGVFIGLLTIPAVLVPWFRGEDIGSPLLSRSLNHR